MPWNNGAQTHPGVVTHASSWLPQRSSVGYMELADLNDNVTTVTLPLYVRQIY